jgi:hypothetical protein
MMDWEFKVGSTISLDDGAYIFVGVHGGVMLLRRSADGSLLNLHVSEVHRRMAEPVPRLGEGLASHQHFTDLSQEQRKEIQTRLRHVQEVINGKSDDATGYRPGFDPSTTTQTQRLERKVAELAAAGIGVPQATLRNWIFSYKKDGVIALVDKRWLRRSAALPHVDPRVLEAAVSVIAAATGPSSVTGSALLIKIREHVIRNHPGQEVVMPGDRTLRDLVKGLSGGKFTTGSAKNRRTAANAPQRMFDSRPAWFPGQEVQIDTSPFDVRVRGSDGMPTTVKLAIAVDKATRSVVANTVAYNIDGEVIAYMLAEMSTPRSSRAGSALAFNELELDHLEFARGLKIDAAVAAAKVRPMIRPVRIITDNGTDYLSETVLNACHRLGISVLRAAVSTPTDKAIVERDFKTIKTMFVHHLPGNTGGSVENRGRDIDSDNLIGVETLALLFDRWVDVVWQNLPTEALCDPEFPQVLHSPNSMYEAMFRFIGTVPIPLDEMDYISLLPSVLLTIQRDGITFNRRRYDSPALNPFRKRDSTRKTPQYRVHYRRHHPNQVWVFIPETGEHIPCPWRNQDAFAHPYSRAIREMAVATDAGAVSTSDDRHATSAAFIKGVLAAAQREEKKNKADADERELAETQGRKPCNRATAVSSARQPAPRQLPNIVPDEYFPSIGSVTEENR